MQSSYFNSLPLRDQHLGDMLATPTNTHSQSWRNIRVVTPLKPPEAHRSPVLSLQVHVHFALRHLTFTYTNLWTLKETKVYIICYIEIHLSPFKDNTLKCKVTLVVLLKILDIILQGHTVFYFLTFLITKCLSLILDMFLIIQQLGKTIFYKNSNVNSKNVVLFFF